MFSANSDPLYILYSQTTKAVNVAQDQSLNQKILLKTRRLYFIGAG